MINLSAKELDIIRMIADGRTSVQIAEKMNLSLPTIKWYRKRIKAKIGAATTVEVIRRAIEQNII